MMFVDGTTRSVISAAVGDQLGSGKVEVEAPQFDESWEMTVRLTGNPIDVSNIYNIELPAGLKVSVARLDGRSSIINFPRNCAVRIPGIAAVYFLTEIPPDPDGLEIELGAWIDIPSNVHAWPPGVKAPEQVVCRSKEDPKRYKLYKYRREIEGTDYEDTGLLFGGTFTADSWDRFAKGMASILAIHALADEEGS